MAAAIHPNTGPARRLLLTDRGRRVLAFDRAGIELPASYHAWGADDSPRCEYGHKRIPQSRRRSDGGCTKCSLLGIVRKSPVA